MQFIPTLKYLSVIGLMLLSTLALATQNTSHNDRLAPPEVFFFEDDIPSGFSTTSRSPLKLSSEQFKNGTRSLRWQYQPGEQLTIHRPIDFRPYVTGKTSKARSSFATWIYNKHAVADNMTFSFYTNDKLNASFQVAMNFSGWRAIVVPFESDMQGTAEQGMNKLTITPPRSADVGTVYFDEMSLGILVDPRWPHPDYQIPFVNKGIFKRNNRHWTGLLTYDRWLSNFDQATHSPTSKQELVAIDTIISRIHQDLLHFDQTVRRASSDTLLKKYQQFVVTVDKQQRLKPISLWRQLETFHQAKLDKQLLDLQLSSTVLLRDTGRYLLQLAIGYHLEPNQQIKNKLATRFVSLVAHMNEQGFVRGSSFGVMHHQGYSIREWAKALFLMRDVLGDQLEPARGGLSWFCGHGSMLIDKQQVTGLNVDVMNTMLQGMLFSALLQHDKQRRVWHLRALSEWINHSMLNHKGLEGGIQRDGSFFHHRQHYVAYGNGGLQGLTPVVYYLNDTPFAMNEQAYTILRSAVLKTRLLSNDLKIPLSLSGRHPDGKQGIAVMPFNYLAKIDTQNGQSNPDSQLAAAYLRLVEQPSAPARIKQHPLVDRLRKLGVKAEATPQGSWVMNYSSLGLHRHKDWLASVRGYSRYLVGNEMYRNANHFGRYINFGHLEILPANHKKRAFRQEGWDWNRWPGTTVIHLPLEKLAAQINHHDAFSGHEPMLLSSESYSGANQLGNRYAMFAMKLRGHPRHDRSFRARKSVFFFRDLIIALGSGINNTDSVHSTQTTLFQDHLASANTPIAIGEQTLSGLNTNQLATSDSDWYLLDTNNNAYIIAAGQRIIVQRWTQHSFENKHKRPTQGNFASAVIDHGKAPDNAGYEYAIIVDAGADRAALFASAQADHNTAPYRVLQRDNNAHIVVDRTSGVMAYALFEASDNIRHGLVHSVDTPVQIMAQQRHNLLSMAVVDPDLGFYADNDHTQIDKHGDPRNDNIYAKQWAKHNPPPKTVKLTLKERWRDVSPSQHYRIVSTSKDTTVIEIISDASTPVQLELEQM